MTPEEAKTFLVASHTPFLAWAVVNTEGPILELGAGMFSTPLIRALSKKRSILTLENTPAWYRKFAPFASDRHEVKLIKEWGPLPDQRWGLAFVDQHPQEARAPSVLALRDLADLIVVHDTEPAVRWSYTGMEEAIRSFKFVRHCEWFPKWTTFMSMTRPLDDLEEMLLCG